MNENNKLQKDQRTVADSDFQGNSSIATKHPYQYSTASPDQESMSTSPVNNNMGPVSRPNKFE